MLEVDANAPGVSSAVFNGGGTTNPAVPAGMGMVGDGGVDETPAGPDVPGGGGGFYGGSSTNGIGGDGVDSLGGEGGGTYGAGGDGGSFVGGPGSSYAGDGIYATPGGGKESSENEEGYAGFFGGDVFVTGTLTASTKHFKIDHPLDPANKYLDHSSVESSEMMNIYTGNVTTDAAGDAVVQLPEWFEAVNGDFRYQLTVIGQFAQAIVTREIANHQFSIKTDKPHVKVSWQVTGVRHDAYAQAHPLQVEVMKPARERGYYIHPELYGAPEEKQIEWARHPATMKRMKEHRARQRQKAAQVVQATRP